MHSWHSWLSYLVLLLNLQYPSRRFEILTSLEYGVVVLPMVTVIILALILPVLINMWYQPELCILTRLEHQWRLRLCAVAGGAMPVHGKHFVYTSTSSINNYGGDSMDAEEEEECFCKIFHQTVHLENLRHFHHF